MELLKKQLEILAKITGKTIELERITENLKRFEDNITLSGDDKSMIFELYFKSFIKDDLEALVIKAFSKKTKSKIIEA